MPLNTFGWLLFTSAPPPLNVRQKNGKKFWKVLSEVLIDDLKKLFEV